MSTIKTESATVKTTTTNSRSAEPQSSALSTHYSPIMPGSSFQLPINMSNHASSAQSSLSSSLSVSSASSSASGSTAGTTMTTTTTTTTRNNISVTNIKCEVNDMMATSSPSSNGGNIVPVIASTGSYYNGIGGGHGIRIPVPKAEDSDSEAELTNIENLKVTRRVNSAHADTSSSGGCGVGGISQSMNHNSNSNSSHSNKNGPRPMSWEGELSETETTTDMELMETENSLSNGGVSVTSMNSSILGLAVIKSEATTTTPTILGAQSQHHHHQQQQHHHNAQSAHHQPLQLHHSTPLQTTTTIKPEHLEQQTSVELHNNSSIFSPHTKLKLAPTQSDPINLKYEPPDTASGAAPVSSASSSAGVNSPLLVRNKSSTLPLPANPSPDSAIHSVYTHSSPSQSPLTSRHAPYTPSLSRNNSDASHSSCYSYSSEFSPTHSPIQGRHVPSGTAAATPLYGSFNGSLHHSVLYRPQSLDGGIGGGSSSGSNALTGSGSNNGSAEAQNLSIDNAQIQPPLSIGPEGLPSSPAGISRQQLINSPCPICGDKISGFHYGIFSCESCKGFFKRTVQNRKNYVCVRGGPCPVSISTRKKCPACRFEKCLHKGMKLEAIREDRTRGGRSTYQCSYTLPSSMLSPLLGSEQQQNVGSGAGGSPSQQHRLGGHLHSSSSSSSLVGHHAGLNGFLVGGMHAIKSEQNDGATNAAGGGNARVNTIPVLLQEIMDVEHLWQYNESELARLNQPISVTSSSSSSSSSNTSSTAGATGGAAAAATSNQMTNPLLASAGLSSNGENANPDLIAHLCNVADHRLYKIVKWCKSLPLFKNISIDDQICLLINSWCELLLFSCCFRSIDTPGEIKMSQGKKISLTQAKSSGLQACIERMLNLTDNLRRLRVDRYEYVAMKVIVLLQSDTSELQEPVKVRECQEKALQSLQAYTLAHYPDTPSKFGELLLRIPDLQKTCQLGKEMLTIKSRDGGDFNLLMELLRGEH